jgi:molecular chaperone GrpE
MLRHKDKESDVQAGESENASAEQTAEPANGESRDAADLQKVIAERDAARAEKAELFDKLQRAQAEFENTRKRLQRDRDEGREYAAMETIETLIPIVDDFERALNAEGLDPDYRKGLELIHNRIVDAFQRLGLRTIEAGGMFDPELHQAVDRAPAESDEDDQKILEVYRKGYKFKDRLLRAAMVKVAVKE